MATQFGNEEVLALMIGNGTLSNLDQVEEALGVIAEPLAHWYEMNERRADLYIEEVRCAFAAMRTDFADEEAETIGKFLNVLIAGAQ